MKKLLTIIPLIIVLGFAFSFQSKEAMAGTEEQNKALVRRYVEAWNNRDFEAFKEVLAPDYQYYPLPSTSPMSREEQTGFAVMMTSAFPDLNISIQQTIAEDNIVVLRSILTGTHEGEDFGEIPATGNKIEFTSITTCRIENGKIVEEKELVDTMSFMQQLGVLPGPGEIGDQGPAAESGATKAEYQSVFKSPQGEAVYMAAYDRALEAWPVPYETRYVPTAYGDTHVVISGPEDGEPLVLLPGSLMDATLWRVSIAALARTYRVYALDTIGDVGKNKMVRALPDIAGAAEWLTDVLDALGIEKTYLAGYSQGGFFTAVLVENIQTVLMPNANHMVLFEQTELVNSQILDFVSEDEQTGH